MRKGAISVLALMFACISAVFAEETLTITTYYPSPQGTYDELRANKMVIGSFTAVSPSKGAVTFTPVSTPASFSEGTLYYDNNEHGFKYRNNTGWQSMASGGIDYGQCYYQPIALSTGYTSCNDGYVVVGINFYQSAVWWPTSNFRCCKLK